MSKKREIKEDLALIATIIQDQMNLIESRLETIEKMDDSAEGLKAAVSTLGELKESCTLTRALVCHLRDNGNGGAAKAKGS